MSLTWQWHTAADPTAGTRGRPGTATPGSAFGPPTGSMAGAISATVVSERHPKEEEIWLLNLFEDTSSLHRV